MHFHNFLMKNTTYQSLYQKSFIDEERQSGIVLGIVRKS